MAVVKEKNVHINFKYLNNTLRNETYQYWQTTKQMYFKNAYTNNPNNSTVIY